MELGRARSTVSCSVSHGKAGLHLMTKKENKVRRGVCSWGSFCLVTSHSELVTSFSLLSSLSGLSLHISPRGQLSSIDYLKKKIQDEGIRGSMNLAVNFLFLISS